MPLPPRLLGSSWGEDTAAWTLLEECGHEPQAGAPEVCWEPRAQGPTCALYASLALLAGLSQQPCQPASLGQLSQGLGAGGTQ